MMENTQENYVNESLDEELTPEEELEISGYQPEQVALIDREYLIQRDSEQAEPLDESENPLIRFAIAFLLVGGVMGFAWMVWSIFFASKPIVKAPIPKPTVMNTASPESDEAARLKAELALRNQESRNLEQPQKQVKPERITQVFLADPSNFTYSTDTPLENGQSTTLFLRRIQRLKFPNLTTKNITNLFIKTRASDGKTHLYTFNLRKSNSSPNYSGIAISNQTPNPLRIEPTLQVGSFRRATIKDIERGLIAAIRRGYTPSSDPVVAKVREFIALARNTSDKTLVQIAKNTKISLPLLTELGLLGIEENLKRPIQRNLPKSSINQPTQNNFRKK